MLNGNKFRNISDTHNRIYDRIREITSMDGRKRKYLRNT